MLHQHLGDMFNLNGLSIATTSVCSKLEYIKVSAMFPSREG